MITFADLHHALDRTGIRFAAYAWNPPPQADCWGVVSIDGGFSLAGDDTHAEDVLEGTIDLFTRRLNTDDFKTVLDCLQGLDICYRLNSVQYEQENRLLHYEWVWQSAAPAEFE